MNPDRINIAGVMVDNITSEETINTIDQIVSSGQSKYLVTTYSEFIVFANTDSEYKKVLNEAALSLPDGIGILWAAKFLTLPRTIYNLLISLGAILFNPNYIRTIIHEQVTGSRIIWLIAKLADRKGYTIALVGGHERSAHLAALKLTDKFSNLKITLIDSSSSFNDALVDKISASNSDILFIAYQPPAQEKWIAQNIDKLNVRVAIGLGGTFDYLAGKRLPAPDFMHYMGLEWLFRLITQPWRVKRMWNAILVFVWIVYKYKVT